MSIAERLHWARELAGFSQRGLAKAADLGDATVRHIESETSESMGLRTAQKIAAVLGCSPGWLLTGEGEAPSEAHLMSLRPPAVEPATGTHGDS
jgi:transcriptional regulator with XRE-family HTH domain